MQANPFLILIIVWIGLCASGEASVRDVSESPSPTSSSSSSKQLNTSVNGSTHPNLVTYPQPTRKAKLDDGDDVGTDDITSQSAGTSSSSNNNNSNESKNSISLTPVAKAATDTFSNPAALFPTSSYNASASKSYCDRPRRPHSGLIIKPSVKTYPVGRTVIFQCHNGVSISASCEEGGYWSRGPPHCPLTNQSCPPHDFANGNITYSLSTAQNPRPLQSVAHFRCNDGFELMGAPVVVCEKGFKWSYRTPVCRPVVPEKSSSSGSLLTALLLSIGILFSLILVISATLWYRWWRRKVQREKWQQYFCKYTYRQSKRKFPMHSNANATHQEMRQFQAAAAAIPSTEL